MNIINVAHQLNEARRGITNYILVRPKDLYHLVVACESSLGSENEDLKFSKNVW